MKGRAVLLKSGMQRNGLEVDKKILEEVVKNFKQPVPIVLGHVTSDKAPAVGFFEKVELKDDALIGEYSLSPIGQILLASNNYRNISAGLRRKPSDGSWYLHHVALLGAMPPGSEDAEPLRIVSFSDEKGELVHFESSLEVQKPKEEVKDMSDKAKKEAEALKKALKKEKLSRLEENAKAKFSEELVKEILQFADSLPLDFSDEGDTLLDSFIKIVSKLPKPVKEGKKEFSDKGEESIDLSGALKAF